MLLRGVMLRGWLCGDEDLNVVAQLIMDGQVEAQFDDPPVFGVPQAIGTGASQKRVQCVDGGLPEVEPVPPGPNGDGDLEAYRAGG